MVEVKGNPKLDTALLPIFQQYKQDHKSWIPDFDLDSYLNLRADYDLAAAFSKLFWPDFVEMDGCIFRAPGPTVENVESWKQHFAGNRQAVEAMLNHEHIHDLFINSAQSMDPSPQLLQYLAQVLLICWRHALQEVFPEKQFAFSYIAESAEISFYQEPARQKGA